jgi:hypothetical protein
VRAISNEKQNGDRDNFTYFKETNPTIDVCLNCTKEDCIGHCELMRTVTKRSERGGQYIIKRSFVTAKGLEKATYVHHIGDKHVNGVKSIMFAKKYTLDEAKKAVEECKAVSRDIVKYIILKRSEEFEKISKENRKTKRRVPDFRVDANGNIIGKRL